MKALVTGGTGYIGSHVVDLLLEHGHHACLFSRKAELPVRLAGKDVSLSTGDFHDSGSLVCSGFRPSFSMFCPGCSVSGST
jgi:uncharacterized protein YbjT (DUF2867 family)